MSFKINDQEYNYLRASDVVRDGMGFEVFEVQNSNDIILEIFYSDQSHEMTITTFKSDIPLDAVEWAIKSAKKLLLPNKL